MTALVLSALHGWLDDEWDDQIKSDAAAGKLDHLLKEVDDETDAGTLRDLPQAHRKIICENR
jgi:hypothetical protein